MPSKVRLLAGKYVVGKVTSMTEVLSKNLDRQAKRDEDLLACLKDLTAAVAATSQEPVPLPSGFPPGYTASAACGSPSVVPNSAAAMPMGSSQGGTPMTPVASGCYCRSS